MVVKELEDYLMELYPNAKCELKYDCDYQLLIAVVLSAQTTDKRVNAVDEILFSKYPTIKDIADADVEDLMEIVRPLGTASRKGVFVKKIANILVDKYDGKVPNDREALEKMPGVGHKTANVVLSNLFGVPAIAVDTHVMRVSKRLGLVKADADVKAIEKKLMQQFDKCNWSLRHHQLVLFGRYHCKAKGQDCSNCKLNGVCKYYRKMVK